MTRLLMRSNDMVTKILWVAAALVVSGAAYAGPSSYVPVRTPTQTVEVNKPYAAVVPSAPVNGHVYQGGPKTTLPHGR